MADSNDKPLVRNIPPFGLRLQPDLKKRMDDEAERQGKSLNLVISEALEKLFVPGRYDLEPIILQLDLDLADGVKGEAENNGRTLEAEVMSVIEEAYPRTTKVERLLDEVNLLLEDLGAPEPSDAASPTEIGLHKLIENITDIYRLPVRPRVGSNNPDED